MKLLLSKAHTFLDASGSPSMGLKPPALRLLSGSETGAGAQGPRDLHSSFWQKAENLLWTSCPPMGLKIGSTLRNHQAALLPKPVAEVGNIFPFSLASLTIRPENNGFDIVKLSGRLPEAEKEGLKLVPLQVVHAVVHAVLTPTSPRAPN